MPTGAPRLSPGEETRYIRVNLPESLLEELRELAEADSRSLSYIGREAIRQYLFMSRARKH
ncbi:ribbon-helix-helix protein, CopG family [Streptomyces sp. NBC_01261]|uniref:ribbon-helix-helix protein, CopG family n=1 Tax=Streptomyces sp. NBC_01261 TaxID=2903802 RepID=UPI003FCD8132